MSEPLQSGYHPDADQICAFVEHELPAHEQQQMLDHLAVCPECRAAVVLSLPPVEEPVHAPPVSGFKPWWSGWRLAWPAGVAAATVTLSVLYIHQASVAPKTSAPAQIAESRPAASPAPAQQSPAPEAKQSVSPAPIQSDKSSQSNQSNLTSRSNSSFSAGVEAPRKAETVTNSLEKSAPGTQSRNAVALDKLTVPARPSAAIPSQISGITARSGGMGASGNSAPPTVRGAPLQMSQPAEKSGDTSKELGDLAITGRNVQALTVVSPAPAIQTDSNDASSLALTLDEAQVSAFIRLKRPLPSGLPALSAAVQARRIVAIDAQYGIFLSKDGGKHWKAIHPQWQGRAVHVERVGFTAAGSAGLNLKREPESTDLKAVGAAPEPNAAPPPIGAVNSLADAPGASLAGTVTDITGAVIPGASVSVIESATHTAHTVNADQAGHFLVNGITPGTYTVEAKAKGFANLRIADVDVAPNRQNVANLSLKIGEETQAVIVSADSMETVTDSAVVKSRAKAKKRATPDVSPMPSPVFAITTDNGERWTSADGVTWIRP